MHIQENFSLKSYNTFGIDARCRLFAAYDTEDELRLLLARAPRLPQPVFHLGGGSNVVFTRDFAGTVFHSRIRGISPIAADHDSVLLSVGASEEWDGFVARTLEQGLYGLENLSLIPGTVGASAVQNIGAYGVEAGQRIEAVEAMDASGQIHLLPRAQLGYAYRSSRFKRDWAGRYVVTRVHFRLSRTFTPNLTYAGLRQEFERLGLTSGDVTAHTLRDTVIQMRRAKLPEPGRVGSAGSFFMNPVVSAAHCASLQERYPDMPAYDVAEGKKIPAAWLIEQAGWRGRRVGDAGVWPEQALVLVNYGSATGADIVALSRAVQADVLQRFGVELQPEAVFV